MGLACPGLRDFPGYGTCTTNMWQLCANQGVGCPNYGPCRTQSHRKKVEMLNRSERTEAYGLGERRWGRRLLLILALGSEKCASALPYSGWWKSGLNLARELCSSTGSVQWEGQEEGVGLEQPKW